MVGGAFSTGHHVGVNDVLEETLVHKDVVNEVPMFGPRMHPGCFKSVFLLEDGVGDDKWLLSAKLQQQTPVVVAVTNAIFVKYSFLGMCILAHSSIETTKDYRLIVCRGALKRAAEIRVELVFFCMFSSKNWSVHTKKRGIPFIFQRKTHGYHAAGMISWQIFQPGGDWGAERHPSVIGFSDQKRVYLAPCPWRLPSPGKPG